MFPVLSRCRSWPGSSWPQSTVPLLPPLSDPIPPLPPRVTELAQQVTGRQVPQPGQRVLALELSCEGEEDDTAFPPLHYELAAGSGHPTPPGSAGPREALRTEPGPTGGAQ